MGVVVQVQMNALWDIMEILYLMVILLQVSSFSGFLHDAVYLYLTILKDVLQEGGDTRDGHLFVRKSYHRTFEGEIVHLHKDISGKINLRQSLKSE